MRTITRLLAAALLAVVATAAAEVPRTVAIEDLTWTELRDRIAGGATTVLVPIGGTEQNGPQMTLGKHNVRARILAEKIAVALGNALVAPVLAYVPEGGTHPPEGHMRFPGTITLDGAAFDAVLTGATKSFALAGFRDIVFLGDHGGYQQNLKTVAAKLNRDFASSGVRTHAVTEYYAATEKPYIGALKQRGYSDAEIGTHAGLADTSLALAVDPGLVRVERLHDGTRLSASEGVYGDPRRASAELGQLGVDRIVSDTVEAIRKATQRR